METQARQIRSQIKQVLADVLALDIDPEQIGDDTILFDSQLGVDSVAAIEILLRLEEVFEIQVGDEQVDLALFQSVASLARTVKDCLAAGEAQLGSQ
jgi:acyl carrier protein